MSIKNKYEQNPLTWNLGIIVTIGGILWAAIAFYVAAEFSAHKSDIDAHPDIIDEMRDNSAKLIRQEIYWIDDRLCDDPTNEIYRDRLAELLTEYYLKKKTSFPREMLKCAGRNGNR